ncbi:MAG TPA: EndoU domain-containing protein [Thermoanaerobaculia bacterium]|nr:EndoU domain-containing protein [Thermoanaerobaculia bacterium]
MPRFRRVLPVLFAVVALVLVQGAAMSRSRGGRPAEEWSPTSPPVNVSHIFEGEINRRGKPTGFHSRPGGHDPANARLVRIVDRPNRAGVYTADVEIRSGSEWLGKRSTVYPDRMDRQAVIQAVLNAFQNRSGAGQENREKFRGPSGTGFTIEGYYQNGRINTAYPIYTRN